MRNPDFIERLCRRLVELGCPLAQVRRLVREVADHREDLKQAALAEGLSGPGAEARTDVQLGDPLYLAERLMAAQRRSSWWGRHYVITFGLLPVLAVPVLWALVLLLELFLLVGVLGHGWNLTKLRPMADDPVTFSYLLMIFQLMDYLAVAFVALALHRLARRAAVNRKWMMIAFGLCSFYSLLSWASVEPHHFSLGFSANLHFHMHYEQWIKGMIPLAVAATGCVLRRRKAQRFLEQPA